jgi:RimJ/RimL family protein N-acetyltransferase
MRWLGGVQSRAAVSREIDFFINSERRDGFTFWAVERRFDNCFLGFCGLIRIRERGCPLNGSIEVGWRIRADSWRKGYAFEAACAVLRLAFSYRGANPIVSRTAIGNLASRGLMQKLGMQRRRNLSYVPLGEDQKLIVYTLTAAQWRSRDSSKPTRQG